MQCNPIRRRLGTFQMKVMAKLGVPGYQPYERLGQWLRHELRPVVKRLLLSGRCLESGPFNPDSIVAAVHDHLEHRRNHTFLLMALMVFEMGQRHLSSRVADANVPSGSVLACEN
jgi:hypothetical protein